MRRRGLALLTTLAAIVVLVLVPHTSASADTPGCSSNPGDHCYSVLQAGSTTSPLYTGMYGTWNRAAMTAGCTGPSTLRWMNSEMWFVQLSSANDGWVEAGHTAGWLSEGGSCDYYAFAAYQKEDGSGYTQRMLARLDHNDAVTDEFQVSRSPTTNVFYVYFNGNRVTTSNVQFYSTRGFHLGAEIGTPYATSHTFNMSARAISNGAFVLLPNPKRTAVTASSLYGRHPSDSAWTWRVNP